jgi:hypothetical protein
VTPLNPVKTKKTKANHKMVLLSFFSIQIMADTEYECGFLHFKAFWPAGWSSYFIKAKKNVPLPKIILLCHLF